MDRNAFRDEYVRVNRKYEALFMPRIKRALHTKTKEVQASLRSGGYNAALEYLKRDLTNTALGDEVRELYVIIGKRHAQMNYSRLLPETGRKSAVHGMETKGFGQNDQWLAFILQYLERYLFEKVVIDINATTRKNLLHEVMRGINEERSIDQMVEALENPNIEFYQAARIVRTEVNRAANVGATAQQSTSPYLQTKEWISAHDNRVRGKKPHDHADHVSLDTVKIDAEDLFHDRISGDYLQFPGDPKASAATTINCRCSVAYQFKRDLQGNLIPRRRSTAVIYPNQNRRTSQLVTI